MIEIFESFEVLTGNHQISIEIEQVLESLKSLQIMNILDSMKFEVPFGELFKDWQLIGHFIKEKFGLQDSDIEDVELSKLNVPEVSRRFVSDLSFI